LKADYPAAIAAYREALNLRRTLCAESADIAILLNALANAEEASNHFTAAERDYGDALRVARAFGHAEMMVGMAGNLAALALDREDWPQAETLARDALSMCEKVGRQQLIASNCQRLAKALVRQGKPAEALPHARRAVDMFTRLGLPDYFEESRETLAECGS